MAKNLIKFFIMYVVLVLSQALIFNHICLFGVAVPLVFIYLIASLPMSISLNWLMTIGFLLGATVDAFSNTQGMNSLSCLILATLRRPVLHLYVPREDDMSSALPSSKSIGKAPYYKYIITLSLIYCSIYFILESMTFFNFGYLLLKICASTLLTFAILLVVDSLTTHQREKRL